MGGGSANMYEIDVRLTDQTFTCAARAHVATAARRPGRAAARRPASVLGGRGGRPPPRVSDFDFTSRLGRRAEAGPRQVLRRVSPLVEKRWRLQAELKGAISQSS